MKSTENQLTQAKDKIENEKSYYVGNKKNTIHLLKEILPVMEEIILNANKEFFTLHEAMKILSLSRTQIYYLRKKKVLPFRHVGKKVYITKEAIRNLVFNDEEPKED